MLSGIQHGPRGNELDIHCYYLKRYVYLCVLLGYSILSEQVFDTVTRIKFTILANLSFKQFSSTRFSLICCFFPSILGTRRSHNLAPLLHDPKPEWTFHKRYREQSKTQRRQTMKDGQGGNKGDQDGELAIRNQNQQLRTIREYGQPQFQN